IGRAKKVYESTKIPEAFLRFRVVFRSNVLRKILFDQSFETKVILGELEWVSFFGGENQKQGLGYNEFRFVRNTKCQTRSGQQKSRVDQNVSAEIFFKSERKKTAIPTKNRYGVDAAIPIALVSTE
ncbi:uncharacterized protein Bfra_001992, partial [Botrytis fragariae]